MSGGEEICKLPSEPPFQLTLERIEPLDTRTQPNAALTYLHAARKSSHCQSPKARKQQDKLSANYPHLLFCLSVLPSPARSLDAA